MQKQRGVALIVVLLVVALVSISATDMGSRLQLQVKRSMSLKDNNQAYWLAIGAEQFAQKTIAQLIKQNNSTIDITQPWAQENIQFPVEGGFIEATLEDMQSCFNLNTLKSGGSAAGSTASATGSGSSNANQEHLEESFKRLLMTDGLDIPTFNRDTLKDALIDWLDEDSMLNGNYGAEDADYESLEHPYLAANTKMASKSELRLVKGVELSWLSKLMPLVCAIPDKQDFELNVNTLTPEKAPVLAALLGVSKSNAESIIGGIPFDTPQQFFSEPNVSAVNLNTDLQNMFVVKTRYFILHVKTTYNSATFKMSSVFKVASDDTVHVIRREFGGKL
ncbi:type II secretion system minor pseudopilin GspK [Planctobacterium marinum]|uniref:Type II secretion system protein K n=1 Tax=Planctobacterium marinum TaxID=1631968 RepID=A0AA48KQ10_9ALTE|nr:type II secretion system protein K [Planctobacterium marinum]